MSLEFLNPVKGEFDNLEAFKKYYLQTICVDAFVNELDKGEYINSYLRDMDAIRQEALKNNAIKVVAIVEMLEESSVTSASDVLRIISKSNSVFDKAEDTFEHFEIGDLSAVAVIYPYIAKAYEAEVFEAHKFLRHKAIEEDNFKIVFFVESMKSLSKEKTYSLEEKMKLVEGQYADTQKVYDAVSKVYKEEKIDLSGMRQKLLLDILQSITSPENAIIDKLMEDLGWQTELASEEIEGRAPGHLKSKELSDQQDTFLNMGEFFNLAMNFVNVNAFRFLMASPNFQKIFEGNQELFAEKMAISQHDEMRLESIKYLSEAQYKIYQNDLKGMIDKFGLMELTMNLEAAIEGGNVEALSLLIEAKAFQADHREEEIPDESYWLFSNLLDKAYEADNPEMIDILLKSGMLLPEDVAHLARQFETEDVKENIFMALPVLLKRALDNEDIFQFDLLLNLAGVENINMPINEDAETAFQIVLARGDTKFAHYLVTHHLTSAELQEEALTHINAKGENVLHNVSHKLDLGLLDKILRMKGAEEALEQKVEKAESPRDGLTPILSIINYHSQDGSNIAKHYAEAGADIFALDTEGYDMSAWVEYVIDEDESHPLSTIHERFEDGIEKDRAGPAIAAYKKGGIAALEKAFLELVPGSEPLDLALDSDDIHLWHTYRILENKDSPFVKAIVDRWDEVQTIVDDAFDKAFADVDEGENLVVSIKKAELDIVADEVDDHAEDSDVEGRRAGSVSSLDSSGDEVDEVFVKKEIFKASDFVPENFGSSLGQCALVSGIHMVGEFSLAGGCSDVGFAYN